MRNSADRRSVPLLAACVLVPSLLFVFTLNIAAQEQAQQKSYAVISGTVWTAQEHGAPGLKVKIRRADDMPDQVRWELWTNARGEFNQRVPAAKAEYVVWVDLKGHKGPAAQTNVLVDGDEIRDVSLHLTE